MINQFLTFCRSCGKQILMTRCEETGHWIPCNPLIQRYNPTYGNEPFIDTHGMRRTGQPDMHGSEFGYSHHGKDCYYGV